MPRAERVALRYLALKRGSRHLGEAARQQEVTGVPARDADHLAPEAHLVDVLPKNDFHRHP